MKPKIFVTRLLPPLAMDYLQKEFSVTCNPDDRPLSKAEIIAGASSAEALLCLLTDTIDDEVISACSHLRVISNYAVGFNNIDLASASRQWRSSSPTAAPKPKRGAARWSSTSSSRAATSSPSTCH